MSSSQIKQLISVISIKDVKQHIEDNKEDYQKWLQEETKKENKN